MEYEHNYNPYPNELSQDPACKHINAHGPDGLNTIVKQGPSADAEASIGKPISEKGVE